MMKSIALAAPSLLILSLAQATVTAPASLEALADVAAEGPDALADAADNPGEKSKVKVQVECPTCHTKGEAELASGVETEVTCPKEGCGHKQKLTATVPTLVLSEGPILAPDKSDKGSKNGEKPGTFQKIIKSPVTWTLAGAAIGAGLGAIGGPATAVVGGILGALVGFIAHKIFGGEDEDTEKEAA